MMQYLLNTNRNTLLTLSVIHDNLDLFNLLLQYECNINHQNEDLNTALHIACMNNNWKMVEILVNHKYIIFEMLNGEKMTPLDVAVINNSVDCVRIMVQYENILDITNRKTPVMHAISSNNIEILSILIPKSGIVVVEENNRYLNKNMETNCLLVYAVKSKNLNVVKFLFEERNLKVYAFRGMDIDFSDGRFQKTYLFTTVSKLHMHFIKTHDDDPEMYPDHDSYLREKNKFSLDFIRENNFNNKYMIYYDNTTLNELYYIIKDKKLNDIKEYLYKETKFKINFTERINPSAKIYSKNIYLGIVIENGLEEHNYISYVEYGFKTIY